MANGAANKSHSHQDYIYTKEYFIMFKHISIIFLVSVLFVMSLSSLSFASTFTASADNWINSCSNGSNFNNGANEELRVRSAWWGPGSGEAKNFRSILQFDLAGICDCENIIGATLNMYYYDTKMSDPEGRTYDVHAVTNSWTESGSTWKMRDGVNSPGSEVYWDAYNNGIPTYQPGGSDYDSSVAASAIVPVGFGWMSWDVTDLVKGWACGTIENNGLIVKDSAEFVSNPGSKTSLDAWFYSADYSDPAFRPYIDVQCVPEPSSLAALAAGIPFTLAFARRKRH